MAMTISGTAGVTYPDSTIQATAPRGGGTSTSSAVDITLTSSSTQTQLVTMTAADKYVILPNATTLTKGEAVFEITASSTSYPFAIKNGAGDILYGPLFAGNTVQLTLEDSSTSAGSWTAGGVIARGGYGPVSFSTIAPYGNSFPVAAVGMSSTLGLIIYQSGANAYSVVAASVSGTTVTFGTPATIASNIKDASSTSGNASVQATSLSATLATFTYVDSTNSQQFIIAISVSGTTCTVGSAVALSGTGASFAPFSNFGLTSTTGAVVYQYDDGVSTVGAYLRLYSISGTTITLGTASTLATAASPGSILAKACKTSSNSICAVYSPSGNGTNTIRSFTFSGTTLTAGTASNIATAYISASGYGFAYPTATSTSNSIFSLGASNYSPATNTAVFFASSPYSYTTTALFVTTSGTTISSYSYASLTNVNQGYPFSVNTVIPVGTAGQAYVPNSRQIVSATSAGFLGVSNYVFPYNNMPQWAVGALDTQNLLLAGSLYSGSSNYITAQILKVL